MDAWLRCEISAGQFPTEAAIRGADFNDEEFSLFVPLQRVRPNKGLGDEWIRGNVQVKLLDSRDGFSLVELPGQTFNNGRTITIRADQVEKDHSAEQLC